MISVRNLHVELSHRFRLSIDQLSVARGSVTGIIGPNGAGKSTLLEILALLRRPQSGQIEILGQNVLALNNLLTVRRSMSFVFPQPYLLNESVFYNVGLPLKIRGERGEDRVAEILRLFKVDHLAKQKALSLSQGEKHRVALARALIAQPQLLFLDEPFLSLDRLCKKALMDDLHRIIKERQITTLFVTQEQSEVRGFADDVLMMKEGRILQKGSARDVFTRPASKEVAEFVDRQTNF